MKQKLLLMTAAAPAVEFITGPSNCSLISENRKAVFSRYNHSKAVSLSKAISFTSLDF